MTDHRKTPEVIALILLFVSITLFTVVGFSKDWKPTVASQHGVGVDGVLEYLLLSTGAILIIGTVVFVVFLWKYGRGLPTGSPKTSRRIERRWTLVPIIGMAAVAEFGVLVKGLPVWEQVYGDVPEDALVVDIVAQQFEWIVRYPGVDGTFGRTDPQLVHQTRNPAGLDQSDPAAIDDVVVRNTLHAVAGRAVFAWLQARDVLHSFSVPAFRVKQDMVPGMLGSTQFVPTQPGRFEIACAELCGMGHYQMSGTVVVHTPSEFAIWLEEQTGWFQ